MGTLEGEPSSDLNIDKSWCLILVLIYKATQGRLVDWMASADCSTHAELHFFFFQRSTPTNTFQRGKKRCQLSCLFLKHSVKDGFVHSLGWSCSKACFYGHGHSEQTCIKPICDRTEGITANYNRRCRIGVLSYPFCSNAFFKSLN